jgi:hypothetical protein
LKPRRALQTPQLSCFGVRIVSEIALPELQRPPDRAAAVAGAAMPLAIRLGRVPKTLPGSPPPVYGLQAAGGTALLTVSGVARYLVEDGQTVTVEPAAGIDLPTVRLFLLGSALGIACHQRGLLPLHANTVVAGGGAVAFCGPSGAGKSTLAGVFAREGGEVLGDDVCAITFGDGAPLAWPGPPRIKLWQDAATALDHDTATLDRISHRFDKYHLPLAARQSLASAPLRRVYLLGRAEPAEPTSIRRLRGVEAMQTVVSQTYRREFLGPLGLARDHFALCSALLAQVEVYEIKRAWGLDVLKREFEIVRDHLSAATIA